MKQKPYNIKPNTRHIGVQKPRRIEGYGLFGGLKSTNTDNGNYERGLPAVPSSNSRCT